ncbi:Geraniol 8-hydroxylase [Arachis hypogaea]|nr:Geraniol 8-hydroxylase [Arachis hypogaea]
MDAVMSSVLLFLLTATVVHLFGRSLSTKPSKHKLPPAPKGIPIFGNLLQLGNKPHQTLATLATIHGPIMRLQLGQVTTVVMSSAETAKSALQIHDQHLSNRKMPDAMKGAGHDAYSLPFIPVSPRWRDLRKTCNNLIFSNKNLDASQELRQRKIRQLLADVQDSSSRGQVVDIGRLAFMTTINLLSNTFYSQDLVRSSDVAGEFKQLVTNIMKEVGRPNVADCFPLLKAVDPQGIRRRTGNYFGRLLEIFKGLVRERLRLRSDGGYCPRNDVLDLMLHNDNAQDMYKDKIERLSLDLFLAGTDTITSTVEWAMAELLHNPKVMSKAKSELEEIVGKGKVVEESDMARLPYLQAVIKETLRKHPAVPLLLPRQAEMDVEIQGYTVPKGAQVLVNVWAIGRDPNVWENPHVFSPERFLGSQIDFRGRNFELTPFGAGRRICPGLPLAMRMLFLMLGLFINCFDWKLEAEDMDMDEKFGLTLEKAQPVRVIPLHIAA